MVNQEGIVQWGQIIQWASPWLEEIVMDPKAKEHGTEEGEIAVWKMAASLLGLQLYQVKTVFDGEDGHGNMNSSFDELKLKLAHKITFIWTDFNGEAEEEDQLSWAGHNNDCIAINQSGAPTLYFYK